MMNNKQLFVIVLLISTLFVTPSFAQELSQNKVDLYFFEVPGCPHCENLREWFDTIQPNYPDLNIIEIDGSQQQDLFKSFLGTYNVSVAQWGQVPRVFIGNYTCLGDTPCIAELENQIKNCISTDCQTLTTNVETPKVSLTKLMALAAADAVSPCELAVLTLLLTTIMIREPEKKRKILLAGLAFTFAIFLTYFAFGSLIIFGFKSIVSFASFDKSFLHVLLAMFAIIVGFMNLKDFIFPDKPMAEVPLSWRPKMQELIKKTASVPGAFVVGLLVSFFLTPCTIGPYFVAGGLLSELSWTTSLPYLFMYNLIFIIPMIAMVFAIYYGLSTVEKSTEFRKKSWKYTHLLIALLMFGLGVSMLMGWL